MSSGTVARRPRVFGRARVGGFSVLICLPALALVACAGGLPGTGQTPALANAESWKKVEGVVLVRQEGRSDCGSAALTTALSRFDAGIDPARVRREIGPDAATSAATPVPGGGPPGDGIAAGRLRDVARAQGLQAFVIEATLADLTHEIERGRPVLVGLYRVVGDRGYPHYEVVAGINARDQQILLADPANGWRKEPLAQFAARWRPARNLAVVIMEAEEPAAAAEPAPSPARPQALGAAAPSL